MGIYRQGTVASFYDTPLEVNWILTDMCNYACSYCYGQKTIDKNRFSTKENIESAIKTIASLNRSSYTVTLSGGEPTIHPYFFDALEMLRDYIGKKLNSVVIISNGSRNGDLYDRLSDISSDINLNLNISLHTERVDLEHITNLICRLSNKVNIVFSLMCNPDKWDYVTEIYSRLKELRKDYAFGMTAYVIYGRPNFDKPDARYTEDMLNWIKEANAGFTEAEKASPLKRYFRENEPTRYFFDIEEDGNHQILTRMNSKDHVRYFLNGMHNYKGMHCIMGSAVIAIQPDGRCWGAVCSAGRTEKNIYNSNPFKESDFVHDVICPYENCHCSPNHMIPKFSNETEAELFVSMFKRKVKRASEINQ